MQILSHKSLTLNFQQPTSISSNTQKMNGCELPGNVVLKVEPSDPLHKKQRRKAPDNNSTTVQPVEGTTRQGQNLNHERSCKVVVRNSSENDLSERTDPKLQFDHHQPDIQNDNDGPTDKEDDDLDGFFASLE